MTTTITKYNGVISTLGRPLPAWVTDPDDAVRIAAYDAYADMYANAPDTWEPALRGTNDKPVYVPTPKRVVEATNRYLGKGWTFTVAAGSTDAAAQTDALAWLGKTYVRNKMPSKFFSFKRNMVKLGDAIIHVFADMSKAAGQRIRIVELSPRTYFRIEDPTDPEALLGAYIVNLITVGEQQTQVAMRMSYRYNDNGTIQAELSFFEPSGWDDRWDGHPPLKPVAVPDEFKTKALTPLLSGYTLPASVTKIPIYHAVNNRQDEDPFGTSEIAGLESVMAGINQSTSDEDITLALHGIGLFVTNASAPVDENGEETDWIVEPGYVAELKGGPDVYFKRVDAVTSVTPYQDHLKFLSGEMDASSGITSTAVGNVDVTVAASGVALRLDMAPILAKNMEKETELTSVLDELAADLIDMWAEVDGVPLDPTIVVSNTFDDPLPVDRNGLVTEITTLVKAGLMSKEFAIKLLSDKLGYQFPADMLSTITADADAEAARTALELGAGALNQPDPNNPTDPNAQPPSGQDGGLQ